MEYFIYEREQKFFGNLKDVMRNVCKTVSMCPMSEFRGIQLLDRNCYEVILNVRVFRFPVQEVSEFISYYTHKYLIFFLNIKVNEIKRHFYKRNKRKY